MKKMTKKEKINHIMNIEAVRNDEIAMEYLKNELKLLDNKATATSEKEKAKEAEDKKKMENILEVLKNNQPMTAFQISTVLNPQLSPQKVTYLLGELIVDGKVTRFIEKRKGYYTLVGSDLNNG